MVTFLSGLLIGILLMAAGMGIYHAKSEKAAITDNIAQAEEFEESASDIAEQQETSQPIPSEEENKANAETEENQKEAAEEQTEESIANGTEDTYNKEKVYVGGDEVAYHGKVYRAKWWTQGEEPGKADVWEDLLIAAGQSIASGQSVGAGQQEEAGIKELPQTKQSSDKQESAAPRTDVEKKEDFKVVGYFPSWKENTDKIQYDVLTHINYAFAIPTAEGKLRPLENEAIAQKIIAKAHKEGVHVFIAIGGWSYMDTPLEATFVSATETAEKRTLFVNEILAMCDKYGFDGVDMDWEHPRVDGGSSKQYEALMLELADKLHAKGKQLSSAVLSGATADGNIYYDAAAHTDKVLQAVDWINVMAYDGGDGERHSAYEFAVNSGNYWKNTRKMSAGKVVLGVPFYARPSWAAYGDILAAVPDAWKTDHTNYNGMEAWYNGVATIEAKTKFALENLGGIMIWEVAQDTTGEHSLQTAIGRMVKQSKK